MPLTTLALVLAALALGALLGWLASAARAARLTATLEAERSAATRQAAALQQAETRFRDAFQALSADALRRNNDAFLQLAESRLGQLHVASKAEMDARRQAIDALVAPLHGVLAKVDGRLQQTETDRAGAYAALVAQVRAMQETQRELADGTRKLAAALRSPTVRGRWGEIQLRRVCEMAGMLDHCDFVEQESVETADGRLRPDLTVKLPGGKVIIVDAKAPLQAYLDAMEATDDASRDAQLRLHARHVRDHMTALGQKAYWGQFAESPELVVMFLPGETFFSAALQHDPALIEYGVAQKVIPASPTTLIALLRSVAYGWQQERVARNAAEISELGRELYERLRVFASHHDDLRRGLQKAVESYNRSVGSLERMVLPQARRFRDLGATAAAELPEAAVVETTLRVLDGAGAAVAPDAPTLAAGVATH